MTVPTWKAVQSCLYNLIHQVKGICIAPINTLKKSDAACYAVSVNAFILTLFSIFMLMISVYFAPNQMFGYIDSFEGGIEGLILGFTVTPHTVSLLLASMFYYNGKSMGNHLPSIKLSQYLVRNSFITATVQLVFAALLSGMLFSSSPIIIMSYQIMIILTVLWWLIMHIISYYSLPGITKLRTTASVLTFSLWVVGCYFIMSYIYKYV